MRSDHIRELTKEDQIILDKQKAEQELTAAERPVETTPSAEEAGDVISLRAKVGGTLRLSTGIKKLISSGILNYRDFVRFLIFFFFK